MSLRVYVEATATELFASCYLDADSGAPHILQMVVRPGGITWRGSYVRFELQAVLEQVRALRRRLEARR